MASLFVIQGRDQGQRFELAKPVLGLGRDTSNPIQLHDQEVSRRHAEIHRHDDGFTLVDLSSSNGTFVNSEQIERCVLSSGDRVQIGCTLMIFTGQQAEMSENLDDVVDIVTRSQTAGGSRIVKTIGQEEGSRVIEGVGASQSPWLARASSNLQVMYHTALAVSHTLDIDQLLHRIMELIFEWVEADRGCVMLPDSDNDCLVPRVRRTRQGVRSDEKITISQTILDYVMENKEGVLTSDAREDERWDSAVSIVKMGVREAICVPMQGRYGVVGIIYIDTFTPPGRFIAQPAATKFNEQHLKLMVAIGHQAALAVEDTSYYSAMVQAERLAAVGQAIATLSHHIKNILQGIRGGSYLIEEGLKSDESDVVRKGWAIVEKNQELVSNLVLDMLTFSKERQPELAPSDMNRVTADVVELMRPVAEERGVQLVGSTDRNMPTLTFDDEGLHRAILNVVTNAIDACEGRPNGRVQVSTEFSPQEAMVRVIVQDNGTGIDPEDLNRIFTIFESRKGRRGTGLGLPVSQKILQEHGGDILVQSSDGAGSRFMLQLPAVPPDTGDTGRPPREPV